MLKKIIKIVFVIVCVLQIFYVAHFRSGFRTEILKNPFNKNSGIEYALTSEVIETNLLLKKAKANNFNLSNEIKKNTYLYQRTIESNYPLRIFDKSKFVFFYISETNPSGCKIVETGEHLKLLQC
tara:strand:+ start:56 stop:430 length:375 start_codon:yes stop_codon:yes gene_type:complete